MTQIQLLSFPHCNLTPPNLTSSPQVFTSFSSRQLAELVGNQHFPSWSFNSLKRVSKFQTSLRKCGGLVRVRCGLVEDESVDDGFYMRRCVELARRAIGCTSPNPMVGCVIVKDGKIVGEGFHPKAGQPHAEVFALRNAGNLAENATAYVSLEPCNHYGRTPPCTEALIKAKVKRVVVGMVDPNPIVASKGVDRLRDAGINVTVGVEEKLCKRLNEAYIHQMLTGKPFVTLRYSLSVNGHLLDQLGDGVTQTGGYYSKLLQEYDAIILSASLTEKFSSPTSQEPGANQPLQIVIASNPGQLPAPSKEASKIIIFSDKEVATEADLAQKGIDAVNLDRINLTSILEYCKRQGFCSILLDLRGSFGDLEELLRESIEQNVLQKIVLEVLPFWDESNGGVSLVALNSLVKRLEVKNLQSMISTQSIVLEGYLQHR
ncbi:riboflavin biosynthesis protein PYRD, chloroplastic-like [Durio zibethinus]|uniref:Riboflavin biosynthesis protein PYRD, chloroplastic n=1 Tax=Durio zibethinus TaxID=66656 RepID=A0A6P5ZX55_DURZI|nr:riboflavin biosynthesis protein PYRD, chloroplastic-like [Durio zibethinus]XP_022757309.1 riboflavin biosynthesis protein PYRD, chloroplastic-like [Durio zibethinus]